MPAVVKLGGAVLAAPEQAAAQIAGVAPPLALVHGGGIQITRMLAARAEPSRFIDGLRVTDPATLEAVALAILGQAHAALVRALQAAGLPAVGVFGAVHAQPAGGPWGLVGAEVTADAGVIQCLLKAGRLPVVPALAVGSDSLLNVNGDDTAVAVALAVGASRLLFISDVPGVLDGAGRLMTQADADALIGAGFVSGGMLPKLRAVRRAIHGGVRNVRIGRTVFGGAI